MVDKFNLELEINKLDRLLQNKEIISTIDMAFVFNFCDRYIKDLLGMDILSLYDKTSNGVKEVTRYLIFCLYSEDKILNLIKKYGI